MRILDLSAGNRAVWFDKKHPIVTFVDIRPEVRPDVIADSRNLPFNDSEFDLFVFDPPHVNFGANANMSKYYGWHTTENIRSLIKGTAIEAHRTGKENSLMVFKWNTHDQRLDVVLTLMAPWWEPLFGHAVNIRTRHPSITYWVMLKRATMPVTIEQPMEEAAPRESFLRR